MKDEVLQDGPLNSGGADEFACCCCCFFFVRVGGWLLAGWGHVKEKHSNDNTFF